MELTAAKEETAVVARDPAMSNEQNVAIFMASLPETTAAVILQRLSPAVLGRVANAIRNLGVIAGDVRTPNQKSAADQPTTAIASNVVNIPTNNDR